MYELSAPFFADDVARIGPTDTVNHNDRNGVSSKSWPRERVGPSRAAARYRGFIDFR
jgi:hypothetical protein